MPAQLIRRMLVSLLTLMLVSGGLAAPSWADEDAGLCKPDHSRGSIPSDFAPKACFDGATLYFYNDTQLPLALTVTADGTSNPQLYTRGEIDPVSKLLASLEPQDFGVTPIINAPDVRVGIIEPGYRFKLTVGSAAVKVQIAQAGADEGRRYLTAQLLARFTPVGVLAEAGKSLLEAINELNQAGVTYLECKKAHPSGWSKVKCDLQRDRDVLFAVGRLGFNVLAKDIPKAVVQMFETLKWANDTVSDANKLHSGARDFTIAASTPPSQTSSPKPALPAAPKQPTPQPPSNSGNGGTSNPPPSNPSTVLATVQNKHLVGASGLAEDSTPAYLSSSMQPYCSRNNCEIGGTTMWSGDTLTALCWNTGAFMTNSNTSDPSDDANPNRDDSTRWLYGEKNNQRGYISEIYLTPTSRTIGVGHC